ncbi:hypothetical protein [Streptomyces sp. NPDC047070]|uniref:hypothetical protein n=1 Tax=Streptomyces sp. NPDC047070 TaxID=3154923 RepID=UPI00345407E1
MPTAQRRTVHITRTEHTLPLPASLVDVAETLDAVRAELATAGRTFGDAELRLVDGALVASYDSPRVARVAP